MRFELKPLVAASLSEKAIEEVNEAMNKITDSPMQEATYIHKLTIQHHLFDAVPTKITELDEP